MLKFFVYLNLWHVYCKIFQNQSRGKCYMEQTQSLYMYPLTFKYDLDLAVGQA